MSRISCDEYKTESGALVNVPGGGMPPNGSVLWNGYDYGRQCWVHEGERDTRTLEELRSALAHKSVGV